MRQDGMELHVCGLSILMRDLGDITDAYVEITDVRSINPSRARNNLIQFALCQSFGLHEDVLTCHHKMTEMGIIISVKKLFGKGGDEGRSEWAVLNCLLYSFYAMC